MKYVKEFSVLVIASLVVGCGPSAEEKGQISQDSVFTMPSTMQLDDSLVKLHYTMRANFKTKNAIQTALQIEHLCAASGGYIERSTIEKNVISTNTVIVSKDSSQVLTQFNHQGTLLLQVPINSASSFVDSLARYSINLNLREIITENLAGDFAKVRSLKNEQTSSYSNFQKDYATAKPAKAGIQEQYETKQTYLQNKANTAAALNNLHFQARYALIELRFADDTTIEQKNIQHIVLPQPYGSDILSQFVNAFQEGCTLLKNIALFLLRLWPLLILTVLIVVLNKQKRNNPAYIKNIFRSSSHK